MKSNLKIKLLEKGEKKHLPTPLFLGGVPAGSTISTLLHDKIIPKIARYCPLVIQGFSNFLGLFQGIMANPVQPLTFFRVLVTPFCGRIFVHRNRSRDRNDYPSEQCSRAPGWLFYIEDWDIIRHYKDPYKPTSIMECHKGFEHCSSRVLLKIAAFLAKNTCKGHFCTKLFKH